MKRVHMPERFDALLSHDHWPSISAFMPTERGGPEVRQNQVRLRHLLADAREQLVQGGMAAREADRLLAPARALKDDVAFWRHNQFGLAVFIASDVFETVRLDQPPRERVIVADRFYIMPLISVFDSHGDYFLLALSQNLAQLYRGHRLGIEPMPVQGLPTRLDEALAADDLEESLQFHTQTGPQGPPGTDRPAVFHGQGVGTDDARHRKRVIEYCRIVNQTVHQALQGRREPMVIAGVSWIVPVYHEVNSYPHLLQQAVVGNVDHSPLHELHERSWAVVEPVLSVHQQAALRLYHEAHGTPRALDDLSQVLVAAAQGRVDTLLTAPEADVWGRFDAASQVAELHDQRRDHDENLLNLAAMLTLRNAGEVHQVDVSQIAGSRPAAAVLRY
jgi:hypothetical protein